MIKLMAAIGEGDRALWELAAGTGGEVEGHMCCVLLVWGASGAWCTGGASA